MSKKVQKVGRRLEFVRACIIIEKSKKNMGPFKCIIVIMFA